MILMEPLKYGQSFSQNLLPTIGVPPSVCIPQELERYPFFSLTRLNLHMFAYYNLLSLLSIFFSNASILDAM